MKKITLKFHTGEIINDAVLLGQALLVLLVKVGAKTFLVSRESLIEDFIVPPANDGTIRNSIITDAKTVEDLEKND